MNEWKQELRLRMKQKAQTKLLTLPTSQTQPDYQHRLKAIEKCLKKTMIERGLSQ